MLPGIIGKLSSVYSLKICKLLFKIFWVPLKKLAYLYHFPQKILGATNVVLLSFIYMESSITILILLIVIYSSMKLGRKTLVSGKNYYPLQNKLYIYKILI